MAATASGTPTARPTTPAVLNDFGSAEDGILDEDDEGDEGDEVADAAEALDPMAVALVLDRSLVPLQYNR